MPIIEKIVLGVVIAFLAVAALRLLSAPLKLVLRLCANTLLGFGALYLVNLTSAATGLCLGFNLFNALIVGILGVPGFGLLVLLQWVLT